MTGISNYIKCLKKIYDDEEIYILNNDADFNTNVQKCKIAVAYHHDIKVEIRIVFFIKPVYDAGGGLIFLIIPK